MKFVFVKLWHVFICSRVNKKTTFKMEEILNRRHKGEIFAEEVV